MSRTKGFRDQHQDLLGVVRELDHLLVEQSLGKDAGPARSALSRLAGKLKVHLAMEDNALYPRIMETAPEDLKALAQGFIDEMGGIGVAFGAYCEQWPTAGAIEANAGEFVTQTRGLFKVLGERIDREESQLYARFDAA